MVIEEKLEGIKELAKSHKFLALRLLFGLIAKYHHTEDGNKICNLLEEITDIETAHFLIYLNGYIMGGSAGDKMIRDFGGGDKC